MYKTCYMMLFLLGLVFWSGCDKDDLTGGGGDGGGDEPPLPVISKISITTPNPDLSELMTGVVTFHLDPIPNYDKFVYYSVGGTATFGTDYSALNGVTRVPAGNADFDIVINPVYDGVGDAGETIIITIIEDQDLTDQSTYTIDTPNEVTITLNEVHPPTATITGSSIYVNEPDTVCRFTVSLDMLPPTAVDVEYLLSGTAVEGSDYTIDAAYPLVFQTTDQALTFDILLNPSIYDKDSGADKILNITLLTGDVLVTNPYFITFIFQEAIPPTIIYGIDHSTDTLVAIDITSGITLPGLTTIGSLGIDVDETATMDYDAINSKVILCSGKTFYTINITTGAATQIADLSSFHTIFQGISYDGYGTLHGFTSEGSLYSIDLSTGATLIGTNTIITGTGIEFDNAGDLWLADESTERLFQISKTTAGITWSSTEGVYYKTDDIWDIDSDPVGDIWVTGSEDGGLHMLVKINKTTGGVSEVFEYYNNIKAIVTLP